MTLGLRLIHGFAPIEKEKTFSTCPGCGCKELLHVEVDWFCTKCDWDTTFAYVQSGRMDRIKKAIKEHGFHKIKQRTMKTEVAV
jgi:hypothetical protein